MIAQHLRMWIVILHSSAAGDRPNEYEMSWRIAKRTVRRQRDGRHVEPRFAGQYLKANFTDNETMLLSTSSFSVDRQVFLDRGHH